MTKPKQTYKVRVLTLEGTEAFTIEFENQAEQLAFIEYALAKMNQTKVRPNN